MRLLLAVLACAACAGCAGLPPLEGRVESNALANTGDTRLARAVTPEADAHPGLTGIHPMLLGTDAFAARALLARVAERSIDVQYYLWHADQTGLLMMEALRDAASRGARVRFLLDDQGTGGMDGLLSAFASTPNVEVRLYNPFANRGLRALGYLGDFDRLNRRMHNKAFIVDNQAAIVGGRNIGNEYFGAGAEVPFMDLDVVALGRAVPELSAQFDLYWNSASAYPIAAVVVAPSTAEDLDARFASVRADPVSTRYVEALRETPIVSQLLARRLALEWVTAVVVRDDPAKTLDPSPQRGMLALAQIFDVMGAPQRSFDLISPYFVPGERGTEVLGAIARRGIAVRVLTNSLASNDVAIVHSGYAKRRCDLATAGVKLYELKPEKTLSKGETKHAGGSSAARLHAKTFAVDREHLFVGSFNFDLRSGLLNTELGLVLHSPVLASRLAQTMDTFLPSAAYEVRHVPGDACVEWMDHAAAGDVRMEDEPNSSAWNRFWLAILMTLPIDWML
jgi:putative cardiolipin synthase